MSIAVQPDIVGVVAQHVDLRRSGDIYVGLCPFHAERTPSFFVFPGRQRWRCFGGCGISGDVSDFIARTNPEPEPLPRKDEPAPGKRGMTITELAADYGLSASFLYKLARANKLPGCRRLGWRFVCLREEFEDWIRAGGKG